MMKKHKVAAELTATPKTNDIRQSITPEKGFFRSYKLAMISA